MYAPSAATNQGQRRVSSPCEKAQSVDGHWIQREQCHAYAECSSTRCMKAWLCVEPIGETGVRQKRAEEAEQRGHHTHMEA
jgi:hypothetical protein